MTKSSPPDPCPFCGATPRLFRKTGVTGTAVRSQYLREQVRCKCGAEGPVRKRPGEALQHWNQRKEPTMR